MNGWGLFVFVVCGLALYSVPMYWLMYKIDYQRKQQQESMQYVEFAICKGQS